MNYDSTATKRNRTNHHHGFKTQIVRLKVIFEIEEQIPQQIQHPK